MAKPVFWPAFEVEQLDEGRTTVVRLVRRDRRGTAPGLGSLSCDGSVQAANWASGSGRRDPNRPRAGLTVV